MQLWRRSSPAFDSPEPGESETDARPSPGHPRRIERDPEAERRSRMRRRFTALGLVAVFVAGCAAALLGEHGWLERRRLSAALRETQSGVREERERVAQLEAAVARLRREPIARERIAREQLGYARPDEVLFLLPRDPGSSPAEGSTPPPP